MGAQPGDSGDTGAGGERHWWRASRMPRSPRGGSRAGALALAGLLAGLVLGAVILAVVAGS